MANRTRVAIVAVLVSQAFAGTANHQLIHASPAGRLAAVLGAGFLVVAGLAGARFAQPGEARSRLRTGTAVAAWRTVEGGRPAERRG